MNIIKLVLTPAFAYSVLRVTTPILLASLGALMTEKAGLSNLAVEGIMLFGALFGVIGSAYSGSAFVGVLSAILISIIVSAVLAYFTLELKADMTLACIALNLLASGGTVFLLFIISGNRGMSSSLASKVVPQISLPLINKIPIVGEILSGHNLLTYMAFILVAVEHVMLYRMPIGLRVRSVGENSDAAASVGISVKKTQYTALILCGVMCGLAGAFMSMGYLQQFNRDMVAGRGYIALAACNVGGQTPLGTMFASLLFGLFDALSNNIQGISIPIEFIQTMPYIATMVFLALFSYRRKTEKQRNEKTAIKRRNLQLASETEQPDDSE